MAGKLGQTSDKLTAMPVDFTSDFLKRMDGRTRAARFIKDRIGELMADLGGESSLSYQERSLVTRAIHLEAVIMTWEDALRRGKDIDMGKHTQALNSLLGLYRHLGLQRRTKPVHIDDYIRRYGT